jgi:D-alanyl-D-alanine carboxypeptidase/D-alanyl-D-alanine-endopeptidase (penicillin-binding protein 4)
VELLNEVDAVTSGRTGVGAYRTTQPNRIAIRGRCKDQEGPFDVAIENPAAFFGFVLAERLARGGIVAQGHVIEKRVDADCDFVQVAEFATPLIECLHRANKDSLGLVAEVLLKTVAAYEAADGENGSWSKGCELAGKYLSSLGVPGEEFNIDDGSGLSRNNRLSARAIMAVLLDRYTDDSWEVFRDSLAVGGKDGTIDGSFGSRKYRGQILGKTGSISGVKSFSGVCLTANGPYLFAVISNRASLSRDAINSIAEAIVDEYGSDS